MTSILMAAAISGILSGAQHEARAESGFHADGAHGARALDAAKHGCKGQNACKAQGGCKSDKHACKGQNACKGQGGCKG